MGQIEQQEAGLIPLAAPFHTVKGYSLSLAKQVLTGRLDNVIETIEHDLRLV
ncbi:MAG: hypothetical protein ACLPWF_17625 [Bryobacteraceae bacterium]